MPNTTSLAPPYPGKLALADIAAIQKPAGPLYFDGFDFCSAIGFPAGTPGGSYVAEANPPKNWVWYVTGLKGGTELAFNSAGSDAFSSIGADPFPVIIHHDNDRYYPYYLLTSSANTITLAQPLEEDVTNLIMQNVHYQGNHPSELATFAIADALYYGPQRGMVKNEYIAHFSPSDTSGPWVESAGTPNWVLNYALATNIVRTDHRTCAASDKTLQFYSTTLSWGIEWTGIALNGTRGYLEIGLGILTGSSAKMDVILDGVTTTYQIGIDYKVFNVPFAYAKTLSIKIYNDSAVVTTVCIGKCVAWKGNAPNGARNWSPFARVVLDGDSWTQIHQNAMQRRLEYVMSKDAGIPITIINVGVSGTTTEYGIRWFQKNVLNNNPEVVISGRGVNDANEVSDNQADPDGNTFAQGPVSKAQFYKNTDSMVDQCLERGILPIVIGLSASAEQSQCQTRAVWSNRP